MRALDGVDLEAAPGTVLGVLGPNGAGKTTAVRILTTLLAPDAGSARVAGLDVVADAAQLRARIGLAGQYAAVDENLTGVENLVMVGRLYGERAATARKARAHELLERFALTDAGDRVAKTYSGGMRRRLDLAAALVARPPVLFLDEPTTGLDPRSRIDLWETIEELVADGTTVLLTTQYLDEADRLADRIAVIDHGRVIADGTADELKERVGGERVEVKLTARGRGVCAARRRLAGMARRRAAGRRHARPRDRSRSASGAIMEAARRLDRAGVGVDDIVVRRPTLDDVFLLAAPATRPRTSRGDRRPDGGGGMTRLVPDTLVMAERNLVRLPRNPDLLLGFTIQPVMFVLLFVYVFGGAIATPGYDYVDFLIPGIIVQNIAFGGFVTALGLAEDLNKGLIDRFRSLPTARASVLAGRTLADVVDQPAVDRGAAGHRPDHRLLASTRACRRSSAGIGLLLLFGFAFSWIFALIGMSRLLARGGQRGRLHADLPDHVHLVGVRAGRVDAGRAAAGRRGQPGQRRGRRDARAVARRAGRQQHLAVRSSGASSLIAIFAPLAVAKYRRTATK